METIVHALRVHWEGIKTSIAGRMAYRTDFFLSMMIMFLVEFIVPAVTFLIYRSGASFPGWNLYEVLLIQTVFLIAKGIAFPLLCGIVWNTIRRVSNGTYDLLLIKPHSVLHMTMITSLDSEGMGKFFGGIVMFVLVMGKLPAPHALQWIWFLLLLVVSILVLFSFALIMAGMAFKWVGVGRTYEMFESITSFGLYPRAIFTKAFQTIITAFIPVAIIGFLPASVLLGKPATGVLPACAVSLVFFSLSLTFWHRMAAHYSSAGG